METLETIGYIVTKETETSCQLWQDVALGRCFLAGGSGSMVLWSILAVEEGELFTT